MVLIFSIFIILLSYAGYQYLLENIKKKYFVVSMSKPLLWQAIMSKRRLLMLGVADDSKDLGAFRLITLLRTCVVPLLGTWLCTRIRVTCLR